MLTIPKTKPSRIWEVDLLRALAVLGMLLFHWLYLLDYWELKQTLLFEGSWNVFGDLIRNTFFIVIGLSLGLSYQRSKTKSVSFLSFGLKTMQRGGLLLLLGGGIWLITLLVIPENPVRFGVLSFIGAALILLWPLVCRWYLLLSITLLVLGVFLVSDWRHESLFGYVFGVYPYYWPSVDYFPIVPWLASVSTGALLSSILFSQAKRRYPAIEKPQFLTPVLWFGKQALLIYLLHIPLFVGLIWAWTQLR